jgi:1-acyl-sn-glycerol-3-phosphate acyltransferase
MTPAEVSGHEAGRAPSRAWLSLRALVFWAGFALSVLLWSVPLLLMFPLPYLWRHRWVRSWCRFNVWWLRIACGLGHRVDGLANIPVDRPVIVMSKHQSTWETFALQTFLPPVVFVLKRELLRIPFFGWGLAVMRSIAIDRGSGRKAVEQLVEQGRERLDDGIGVAVFPEGTRTAPGQRRRYKLGGAVLASRTGYPVLPIAHNSGEFWPRHSWVKWPGTIDVVIGAPIEPAGRDPEELLAQTESWIEAEVERISNPEQRRRIGKVRESDRVR